MLFNDNPYNIQHIGQSIKKYQFEEDNEKQFLQYLQEELDKTKYRQALAKARRLYLAECCMLIVSGQTLDEKAREDVAYRCFTANTTFNVPLSIKDIMDC